MSHARRTLADWLAWMEAQHPKAIALGLERVRGVAEALGVVHLQSRVVLVGGTNGKGSCCAFLEALAKAHGLSVGVYTSPHILHYHERVRLDGRLATDAELVTAFEAVEEARGDLPLTFFEFGTLAALWQFKHSAFDVVVLEIGLGGRLDAVNIVEPDVSLVTTVDIDHRDYLGDSIEQIAAEKAGIYRAGKPALFGDTAVPEPLRAHAGQIGADLRLQGREFGHERGPEGLRLWTGAQAFDALPMPSLLPVNAASALAAFAALPGIALRAEAVAEAMRTAQLAGRFQRIAGPVKTLVDVAHNPQAARKLAELLEATPCAGRTLAVVAMLGDKDISGTLAQLVDSVDAWFVAGLSGPRGTSAELPAQALAAMGQGSTTHADVVTALQAAWAEARPQDRVVVFGSFYTVAAALAWRPGASCKTP
ncbi:MAG: bifunctional tetrahydrofolate synthase/dihydrofolate synthase [Gammaproteobacteria bacterium]|nr:bifunctional tetrahydrofolate synthase/dihydrofolate synthase [Gammaproteobacteria bacterium]